MMGPFRKCYFSIPHLPGSLKTDRKDGDVQPEEGKHFTIKCKEKNDVVIVTEKLDGTCMGVIKDEDGQIYAINRSGYLAETSPWKHQRYFAQYVNRHYEKLDSVLSPGQRMMGEWMILAHGIKYDSLPCCWFVFDILGPKGFVPYAEHHKYIPDMSWCHVPIIYQGPAISIEDAWKITPPHGFINCDKPEGLVYRIERNGKTIALAKWVRPDFEPGKYLSGISGSNIDVWNVHPRDFFFEVLE